MSFPLPRLSLAAPLIALALAACGEIEQAPPPLHPRGQTAASQDQAATKPAARTTADAQDHDALRKGVIAPRVNVEGVEDEMHKSLAQAIVDASKTPMAECRAGSGGGTVRIRVKSTKTSASFDVEPGASIDEKTRRCVLQALSTIDVPDTLSQSSPSQRPTAGFSSIISVNW